MYVGKCGNMGELACMIFFDKEVDDRRDCFLERHLHSNQLEIVFRNLRAGMDGCVDDTDDTAG
jgi:hypothetical protein